MAAAAPTPGQMFAYYMDDDTATDQRAPHVREPRTPVSRAELAALGVLYWRMDASVPPESDAKLSGIRAARGYSYTDTITISPDKLPNYEAKLKIFFEEHLHTDEEIRYILEGSGFFDVRDAANAWIRIAMFPGDMIVLPAGMYHRFTLDETNYLKAMRLFVGDPVWTPFNRVDAATDVLDARAKYVEAVRAGAFAAAAAGDA